jgi:hypothetical protein
MSKINHQNRKRIDSAKQWESDNFLKQQVKRKNSKIKRLSNYRKDPITNWTKASDAQIRYLAFLGVKLNNEITKLEATILIEKQLRSK